MSTKRSKLVFYSQGLNAMLVAIQTLVGLMPALMPADINANYFKPVPVFNQTGQNVKVVWHELPGFSFGQPGAWKAHNSVGIGAINSVESAVMTLLGRSSDQPPGKRDSRGKLVGRIDLPADLQGQTLVRNRPTTWGMAKAMIDMVLASPDGSPLRQVPPVYSPAERARLIRQAEYYNVELACVELLRSHVGGIDLATIPLYGLTGLPRAFLIVEGAVVTRPAATNATEWNNYLCAPCVLPLSSLSEDLVVLDPNMPFREEALRDLTMLELSFRLARDNLAHLTPGIATSYFLQKVHFMKTHGGALTADSWTARGLPYEYGVPPDVERYIGSFLGKVRPDLPPLSGATTMLSMSTLKVASASVRPVLNGTIPSPVAANANHVQMSDQVSGEVDAWLRQTTEMLDISDTARLARLGQQAWYNP